MLFTNRTQAGRQLAKLLKPIVDGEEVVVYALPRGGVVTAAPIALELKAPIDLLVVKKIGHPNSDEFAIGAINEDGATIMADGFNSDLPSEYLHQQIQEASLEIRRRRQKYWRGRPQPEVKGKIGIIVDDGAATGLTMRAAINQLRRLKPRQLLIALPVLPADTAGALQLESDQLITLESDPNFAGSVGAYYNEFPQVSDDEVIKILERFPSAQPDHQRPA